MFRGLAEWHYFYQRCLGIDGRLSRNIQEAKVPADPAIQNSFLQALLNPALYDHPTGPFNVMETHISWVILTGPFAYKIKKPVNLGFLDFSTLEKRRFYCEEELRTNRRLCPEIYVDVVPITGDPIHPVIGGTGQPFEYAVKMKQFDEYLLWDRMLERGELTPELVDQLASLVATFHQKAPAAPIESPYGLPATFWKSAEATFQYLDNAILDSTDRSLYETVAGWMEVKYHKLAQRMIERRREGFVRELHGDLHLRNIALFSKARPEVLLFDGIEFDDNLRWIDMINDIAFLNMDLEHRRRFDLAWRFLNAYLEITGDYKGMDLLGFYAANRALVRAKVMVIQKSGEGRKEFPSEARDFLRLANTYARPVKPCLYITHGLSGSGKTTVTTKIIEILGAIRIRSDIERKRLFGLAPDASSTPELKISMYGPDGNRRTYDHLKDLARRLLNADQTVIVDAAFLRRNAREEFRDLARQAQADFNILDFRVNEDTLKQRVDERARKQKDASEADLQVLADQINSHEDLSSEERPYTILVDPGQLHELQTAGQNNLSGLPPT